MNKKLQAILLSLFCITASAQYKKMPIDSNYYWKQSSANTNTSSCVYHYQIKYKKDTIIGSKTYNKYSTFGAAAGNTLSPCNVDFVKHGYLRQDTLNKRVFILDNNFIEHPLYNFTKMVGDTMQMYRRDLNTNITVTVTIRDSIQMNDGSYRRRQFAISNSPNYGNYFVEGMGSMAAGLYGHTVLGYIPNSESLNCFGKISPFFTLLGSSNCYLSYVGLSDNFLTTNLIKIYPNPASDILKIEFLNAERCPTAKLEIIDNLGQTVKEEEIYFENGKGKINVKQLTSGIYTAKLTGKNNYSLKFIKE